MTLPASLTAKLKRAQMRDAKFICPQTGLYYADKARLQAIQEQAALPVRTSAVNRFEVANAFDTDSAILAKYSETKFVFYEYWHASCWSGLRSKWGYKNLTKTDAIDRFVTNRLQKVIELAGFEFIGYYYRNNFLRVELKKA